MCTGFSAFLQRCTREGALITIQDIFVEWGHGEQPIPACAQICLPKYQRRLQTWCDASEFITRAKDTLARNKRLLAAYKIAFTKTFSEKDENYRGFQKQELLPVPEGDDIVKQARAIHACSTEANAQCDSDIGALEEAVYATYPVAKGKSNGEIAALFAQDAGFYGVTDMSAFDRTTNRSLRTILRACVANVCKCSLVPTRMQTCHGKWFTFSDPGSVHSGERCTSLFAVLAVLGMQLCASFLGYAGRPINCGDDNVTVLDECHRDDADDPGLCLSRVRPVPYTSANAQCPDDQSVDRFMDDVSQRPHDRTPSSCRNPLGGRFCAALLAARNGFATTRNPAFLLATFKCFGYDVRVEDSNCDSGAITFLQRKWQSTGSVYTDPKRALSRLFTANRPPTGRKFRAYYRGKCLSYAITYPGCPIIQPIAAGLARRIGPVSSDDLGYYWRCDHPNPDIGLNQYSRGPTELDRATFASYYGYSIEQQLDIERAALSLPLPWELRPTSRDVNVGLVDERKLSRLAQIFDVLPTDNKRRHSDPKA